MCKHIAFNRDRWAPCAICLKEKRIASTIKNEDALRAEMNAYIIEASHYESRGLMASAASRRQDAEMIQMRLIEAGC